MGKVPDKDERTEAETEAERDRILKRLLETPPKPHETTKPDSIRNRARKNKK